MREASALQSQAGIVLVACCANRGSRRTAMAGAGSIIRKDVPENLDAAAMFVALFTNS
jgi:hypothetical protein